ncbi:hypothetical protein Pelo_16811, partial [Pelomyxa schiedti]
MCFHDYVPPQSSSPVCFGPNSTIKMSNGKERRMKDIAVGDRVEYHLISNEMTLYKTIGTVRCIWRKTPEGTNSILEITLDHPVPQDFLTNKWCMPASILGDPHFFNIDCVYNIVVDSAQSPSTLQSQDECQEPEQHSQHTSTEGGGGGGGGT